MPKTSPSDPDSTFKGAHVVGPGTYFDTLTDSSDADVFRFRLKSGQTVTLDTDNGGDFVPDTQICLFDSRGRLLAENDDYFDPNGNIDFSSFLEYTNTGRGGKFYVVVTAYPNDAFEGDRKSPQYTGGDPFRSGGDYSLDILIA